MSAKILVLVLILAIAVLLIANQAPMNTVANGSPVSKNGDYVTYEAFPYFDEHPSNWVVLEIWNVSNHQGEPIISENISRTDIESKKTFRFFAPTAKSYWLGKPSAKCGRVAWYWEDFK